VSPATRTLWEVLIAESDVTRALDVIRASWWDERLDDPTGGPYTIFVPVNSAFEALDQVFLNNLLSNAIWHDLHISNFFEFHLVDDQVLLEEDLVDEGVIYTLNSERISVDADDGSGVTTIASPNTVAAHIIGADLRASNGVAHKLDAALLPGFWNRNLVAAANRTRAFNTFLDLIDRADFVESLSTNLYTVLAPTYNAWSALGQETLDSLRDPANQAQLLGLLQNHLLSFLVPTNHLMYKDGQVLSTVAGLTLTISANEDNWADPIMLNDATIVFRDVLANNGYVQGIDTVLLSNDTSVPTVRT
jgi:uncharacterized surface protein with fasciclin (FAS1) repeats